MKHDIFFILFIILFSALSINAQTYYCNPNGGNLDNPGTVELPLPSLQKVLSSDFKLMPGDSLILMSGNHGTPELKGINANYIFIIAAKNQNPVISHLDIAKTAPTTKWYIKNINFSGENSDSKELISFYDKSMFINIEQCNFYSKENTETWSLDKWKQNTISAITIKGSRHKLISNSFKNISTAIHVKANNCTFSGNKINNFTNFGFLCEGNNNIFTNNLIKNLVYTGFNAAAFKAGNDNTTNINYKSNILLGNVIIDYTNPDSKHKAPLMGIIGFDASYSDWIIENNLIVTDHWHGISFMNMKKSLIINNTVIDPYLGTKYSNLEKDLQSKSFGPVRIWITQKDNNNKSLNNRIINNLVSDFQIDDSLATISNNIKVPSSYSAMDRYFQQWDYLNFNLRDSSLAINAGNNKLAPKIDASGTSRPIGKTVNIGAYEYGYVQAGNQTIKITAEKTDQEIRSNKQKADWIGQKSIRVGGSGTNFDAVMIMPFALPPLPEGFIIKSAKFSVNLEKIDNSPKSTINLHGLIPRKTPNALQADFYQGNIMSDLNARPIQPDFLGRARGGLIKTTKEGNKVLANYLNSLYQSGFMGGDYVFLRLSPNSNDIKDYHRWIFSSANTDDFDKRPTIEVVIGKADETNTNNAIKKTIIISSDILYDGNFTINLLGFEQKEISFQILDSQKNTISEDIIKMIDNTTHSYKSNGKISLKTGDYFLIIENITKKFTIW